MMTLRDVVRVLNRLYDPAWAESWDAVGTTVGDPAAHVGRILLAVDPVQAVADEAVEWGADLLLTHHPLYLSGVTSVAADTPKGRVVHTLAANNVALHTCHTNADSPALGVSESMALALGLTDLRPLAPDTDDRLDSWTVYVPQADVDPVAEAMWNAGAGAIGDYNRASFRTTGTGTFRPLAGANPTIGDVGSDESVDEVALQMVAPAGRREAVRRAMRAAHPYEEAAHDVVTLTGEPSTNRGSGRIGELEQPMTLAEFGEHVARCLPSHNGATRVAGDLDATVTTVALCGGSGDFLLPHAQRAGADVYVTSDLKHHPVSEHMEQPDACAVIDVPHWAAEWTWLPVAASALRERLGDTVDIRVSTHVTDPWTTTIGPDTRSPR